MKKQVNDTNLSPAIANTESSATGRVPSGVIAPLTIELDELQSKALAGNLAATMLYALCIVELDITPVDAFLEHLDELYADPDKFWKNHHAGDHFPHQEEWLGRLGIALVDDRYRSTEAIVRRDAQGAERHMHTRTNTNLWNVIDSASDGFCKKTIWESEGLNTDDIYIFAFYERGYVNFASAIEEYRKILIAIKMPNISEALGSLERTKTHLQRLGYRYAEAMYLLGSIGDKSEDWLVKASNLGFMLASYRLGFSFNQSEIASVSKYLGRLDMSVQDDDGLDEAFLSELRERAASRFSRLRLQFEVDRVRSETIESMMAMFSHQFRGAVGSIRFNAEHQNDANLYLRLAHSMSGLLEIFGIVSTAPERLASSFREDVYGDESPERVLLNTFKLSLAELLSQKSRSKISPYYRIFAQRQGVAPKELTQVEWGRNKMWSKVEAELQVQWEAEFSKLMPLSDLDIICQWFSEHFLPVQVNRIDASKIRFSEFGPKASLIAVVMTEIFVNAIKYSVAGSSSPLEITWEENSKDVIFQCINPSSLESRQRELSKGSGRGHKFLSLIASQLGGTLLSTKKEDYYACSFSFPNDLIGAGNE